MCECERERQTESQKLTKRERLTERGSDGKMESTLKTAKCFNCIGSYKEPTLRKQITKKFRAKVGRFYYRG